MTDKPTLKLNPVNYSPRDKKPKVLSSKTDERPTTSG
jgi:hypothetical protein